jgi:hypothetical protein
MGESEAKQIKVFCFFFSKKKAFLPIYFAYSAKAQEPTGCMVC